MEYLTSLSMMILLGGVIYIAGMFLYRRAQTGETFNLDKFATTLAYVFILAIAAYLVTGFIPDFNALLVKLEAGAPNANELMTAGFAILAWIMNKLFKSGTPATTTVPETVPTVVQGAVTTTATVSPRPTKMTDSVKQWLIFDATPDNKTKILTQIAAAEAQNLATYYISFDGGFYKIEYGNLISSAGNPAGKY